MRVFAFDTETHLIKPGMLAPKLVCGSFYDYDAMPEQGLLLPAAQVIGEFMSRMAKGHCVVGANIAYDFGVLLAYADYKTYPKLRNAIWDAYEKNRVWDIQIAEALYGVAQGHLGSWPPLGIKFGRYSLAICVQILLGRDNAKENDAYRKRYGELDDFPIAMWPPEAREYPIDDVRNTLECFYAQIKRGEDKAVANNIHEVPSQCRAAWALHLGALWGFRVDQRQVNAYEREIETVRIAQQEKLIALGLLRPNGKVDTKAVQRKLLTGMVSSFDLVQCDKCQATGQQVITDRVSLKGRPLKDKIVKCRHCDGVGLYSENLDAVATTKGGEVSTKRDSLYESGDEDLILLATLKLTDKTITTYVPYLRDPGDAPLTLKPNVVLDTGRVSYQGSIQQFPRKGGLRECIVPREKHVFYSVDYAGLELATFAQVCLEHCGASKLADVLNEGGKPHDMLAARLYRKTNAEFAALMKLGDKKAKALRQSAKPANFGFPGGMGGWKLVSQQRMQGDDTTAPDGTVYTGLRFCILMDLDTQCGRDKGRYGSDKDGYSVLCTKCVEGANTLRDEWFATWPEAQDYFEFVKGRLYNRKTKDPLTGKMVEIKPYVEHLFSRRIRAVKSFSSAANGYFQALAADGAKLALWAVVKEQYTDYESVLFGSRNILFAHDELVGELREDLASDGVKRITEIMVREMKRVCPDVAISAEPTLMRRWYKQAQAIYDEKGNVLVWEPTK